MVGGSYMASWVKNIRVADELLKRGLKVDKESFIIGSIAPDCNVENEDWTNFIPTREETHWMSKKRKKNTSDYLAFFDQHLDSKVDDFKKMSFLLGYFVHLLTDQKMAVYIRDEKRVDNIYKRLQLHDKMHDKIIGEVKDFNTLKRIFGKQCLFEDANTLDRIYLDNNKDSSYLTILPFIDYVPRYLNMFPEGAYERKIKVMVVDYSKAKGKLIFFDSKENDELINNIIFECSDYLSGWM